MSPQEAKTMSEFFLSVIDQEIPTTRRVIEAVPDDKGDYRPDENSRTALELARHVAVSDIWFLDAIAEGEFSQPGGEAEKKIETTSQAVAALDELWPAALDRVRNLPGEALAKEINMMGAFNLPAVIYLSFAIRHQVHHRGQLSVYLRPMGGKVPSIYGGSFDEPWQG